jgi:hypothetical protein
MKRFKAEYENCTVTVNSPSFGRQQLDTSKADANLWANIPEFAHMIEDDSTPEPKSKAIIVEDYNDLTMAELRERFPDIEAKTKKEFISKIS